MNTKKFLFGTNTKMFKTIQDTVSFISELDKLTSAIDNSYFDLFVIPSYTTLYCANQLTQNSHIMLGAQNMCWEEKGQFSGEISPDMLKEVGVKTVMLGHSERRHTFFETDEMINLKTICALRNNFIPLICVGETAEQKQYGISDQVLASQIKIALHNVAAQDAKKVRIAYEPVWSIGVNGTPASASYVLQRHKTMRDTLTDLYGDEIASNIPLLYGGSVNPQNALELCIIDNIDGLFIGRSAWQASNFYGIITSVLDKLHYNHHRTGAINE